MLINADQYIEIDKELIFNKYQNVNEFFDFRKLKPFMDPNVKYKKNSFYDHDFVLNGTKPNAILTSSDGKVRLEIDTTYPILHIYTGTLEADTKILGVAIECEKKAFDKDDIFLKKDERYYQKSTYKFIVEGD
jgi:galactose mutarotase-like enzyme